jgi:cystathionine beta-lyase/cystathionine gamma-synthase
MAKDREGGAMPGWSRVLEVDPDLLRLCVGCEPVEEIIAALEEALEHGTAAP